MIATISVRTSDDKRARLNNATADVFDLIKRRANTTNCPRLEEAVNRKLYIVDYSKKHEQPVPEGCSQYGVIMNFDRRERDQIVMDVLKIIDSGMTKASDPERILLRCFCELYNHLTKYNNLQKLHTKRVQALLTITRDTILEQTHGVAANIVNF